MLSRSTIHEIGETTEWDIRDGFRLLAQHTTFSSTFSTSPRTLRRGLRPTSGGARCTAISLSLLSGDRLHRPSPLPPSSLHHLHRRPSSDPHHLPPVTGSSACSGEVDGKNEPAVQSVVSTQPQLRRSSGDNDVDGGGLRCRPGSGGRRVSDGRRTRTRAARGRERRTRARERNDNP
jgi:hypothetical protein